MTTQFVDNVEEMFEESVITLTESEVQILADRIVAEILLLGQKSISKRRIERIVASELEKVGA